jgi:site-specific recombinase XerD
MREDSLAKRKLKAVRGVYEFPKGSGEFWIHYWADGKRHREKIGRRGDAIDAYRDRKVTARRGEKFPDLRRGKVTVAALTSLAVEYANTHLNQPRDYATKKKAVDQDFGPRAAASITPQEIDTWLNRFRTPGTSNRYKSFLSLTYKLGMHNNLVDTNPARLVRQRKESRGRVRFFSYKEFGDLCDIIKRNFPEHLAEFLVAVHTGMRLTEMYTSTWGQVHLDRKSLDLSKTKNGHARTVHLNGDAVAAINSLTGPGQKSSDRVFPTDRKWLSNKDWFPSCLEKAGIRDAVWHTCRHTFCSWLAMKGASLKEIQEAAGHLTIATTAKYAHLSPEHNKGVVERLAGVPQTAIQEPARQTAIKTAIKTATE